MKYTYFYQHEKHWVHHEKLPYHDKNFDYKKCVLDQFVHVFFFSSQSITTTTKSTKVVYWNQKKYIMLELEVNKLSIFRY